MMMKEKEAVKASTELQKPVSETALEGFTPFSFMRRFAEDMERLYEGFEGLRFPSFFAKEFLPFRKEFERVDWVPKIEVLRHNEELTVRAELPGLKKEDIKVELTEEALTLSGERKEEKEEKREGYYRSERSYGSFYRRIPLPEGVHTDKVTATFNNGMLEVVLQVPKVELQTRRVEIREGEKAATAKAATAK